MVQPKKLMRSLAPPILTIIYHGLIAKMTPTVMLKIILEPHARATENVLYGKQAAMKHVPMTVATVAVLMLVKISTLLILARRKPMEGGAPRAMVGQLTMTAIAPSFAPQESALVVPAWPYPTATKVLVIQPVAAPEPIPADHQMEPAHTSTAAVVMEEVAHLGRVHTVVATIIALRGHLCASQMPA